MSDIFYKLNLSEMKTFGNTVRTKSIQPIVRAWAEERGCQSRTNPSSFLYSKLRSINPKEILCSAPRIFLAVAVQKLNMSIEYIPRTTKHFWANMNKQLERHSAFVIVRYLHWNDEIERYGQQLIQVLDFTGSRKLLYVTESEERESFNLLFWTIPFDNYSWILLAVSLVSLSICLKGKWLPVVAILMRQDIGRENWTSALFAFTLMIIVIACCYESIISSHLTVPPPFVKFRTLKDLVDHDYKIFGASSGHSQAGFQIIFDRENITSHNLSSTVLESRKTKNYGGDAQYISYCNSTAWKNSPLGDKLMQVEINEQLNPRVKKHLVTDTEGRSVNINSFFGTSNCQLARIQRLMSEAGLIDFFRTFAYLYDNRIPKFDRSKLEDQKPKSLKLFDWKIISIFIIWGFPLVLALLVIVIENIFNIIWLFFRLFWTILAKWEFYRRASPVSVRAMRRRIRFR